MSECLELSERERQFLRSASELARSLGEPLTLELLDLARYLDALQRVEFLRYRIYHLPLLKALVALGGSPRAKAVRDKVREHLSYQLEREDHEKTKGGREIRWITRLGYTRKGMVVAGFMRSDSVRGIWEISDDGRRLYDALKKHGKKLGLC